MYIHSVMGSQLYFKAFNIDENIFLKLFVEVVCTITMKNKSLMVVLLNLLKWYVMDKCDLGYFSSKTMILLHMSSNILIFWAITRWVTLVANGPVTEVRPRTNAMDEFVIRES